MTAVPVLTIFSQIKPAKSQFQRFRTKNHLMIDLYSNYVKVPNNESEMCQSLSSFRQLTSGEFIPNRIVHKSSGREQSAFPLPIEEMVRLMGTCALF